MLKAFRITPGSVFAIALWLLVSLGFKFYVSNFTSYNATYGAIGGVIVLLLWFYVSALAVLIGAELNAEIEHASPYGKDPGEKVRGEKATAESAGQADTQREQRPSFRAAILAGKNCYVDDELVRQKPLRRRPRMTDFILGGIAVGEAMVLAFMRLASQTKRRT